MMKRLAAYSALFVAALLFSASCSSDDATGSLSCAFDGDCGLGTVCGADKTCVSASCDFCDYAAGQICYKTEANPEGSCSAPECLDNSDCTEGTCNDGVCGDSQCMTNDDCADNEICNLANQCVASDGTCNDSVDCPTGQACVSSRCVPGCGTNEDCEATEFCSAESTCQTGCRDDEGCASNQTCNTDSGRCICTAGGCGDGKFCSTETGLCETATECSQVMCPTDEVCNPADLSCIAACTAGSCGANQVCDTQSGLCVPDTCPGEDPNQCAGTARPVWDPVRCFCATCLSDTDCNMAAGEVCTEGGSCFACDMACDPNTPGTCAGDRPYCFDGCCLECIGAADCDGTDLCLDGFCGQPPNCMVDPTVCPSGTTCNQGTGTCDPTTGGICSPTDPTTCPDGQFCDPMSFQCVGAGGGLGCGLCNPDCTCDNGLNCNGFLCDGCTISIGIGGLEDDCPADQGCIPLLNVCFPGI